MTAEAHFEPIEIQHKQDIPRLRSIEVTTLLPVAQGLGEVATDSVIGPSPRLAQEHVDIPNMREMAKINPTPKF